MTCSTSALFITISVSLTIVVLKVRLLLLIVHVLASTNSHDLKLFTDLMCMYDTLHVYTCTLDVHPWKSN